MPTLSGDTGLWFIPTGNVLPSRSWSISLGNWNVDDGQGFSDINRFPISFAVGLGDWFEVFGNWSVINRIDRDTVPLFFTSTANEMTTGTGGGILVDYPLVRQGWSGSRLGDAWIGGKVNLLTGRDLPFAVAARAQVKLPIGDDEEGVSSGKADFRIDGVASYSTSMFEASGYLGYLVRGNPEGYTLTNGLKWGAGVALFNIHTSGIRLTAELYGERYRNLTITAPPSFGEDGSAVPNQTTLRDPAMLALGLTWHAENGFFIGGGVSTNLNMKGRHEAEGFGVGPFTDHGIGDKSAVHVRIGWSPGRRPISRSASALSPATTARATAAKPQAPVTTPPTGAAVAPPTGAVPPPAGAVPPPTGAVPPPTGAVPPPTGAVPPPTGAVPPPTGAKPPTGAAVPPPAAANRPPTVQVFCDPCTVQAGRPVAVSADAKDPDGNPLTYRWNADSGTFQNPAGNKTMWTAGNRLGPSTVRVTVDDGRGGTADGSAVVNVTAEDLQNLGTVHFDFDKSELRPDAIVILNDAIESLKANPTMLLEIEGHACDIGTTEYNFALGERRAARVRDYLTSHGIAANRLRIISYGEERPKHDNSQEETKKLNRRAELVVRR